MLKNAAFLIKAGVAVVLASVIGYLYYANRDLSIRNRELIASSAVLKDALEESNIEFNRLKGEFDKVRDMYEKAVEDFSNIDTNHEKTVEAIDKAAVDTVEDANKIYRDAIRCIELASGSPLTTEEKATKDEKDFNAFCPWYFGADAGGLQRNQ